MMECLHVLKYDTPMQHPRNGTTIEQNTHRTTIQDSKRCNDRVEEEDEIEVSCRKGKRVFCYALLGVNIVTVLTTMIPRRLNP